MARLIEGNTYQYINKKLIAVKAKILAIDMSQPVEVAPVVHGKWIEHKWAEECDGLLISNYECSECNSWERDNKNFCPSCGAKMDKE